MRVKLSLIALCLVMVAMLAACGGEGEKKAEEKAADAEKADQTGEIAAPATKLVLGVAGAHSGDLASYGLPTCQCCQACAVKPR